MLKPIENYLIVIMSLLSIVLILFNPKWYWEVFIPKLRRKELEHPIVTTIIIIFMFTFIMTVLIG